MEAISVLPKVFLLDTLIFSLSKYFNVLQRQAARELNAVWAVQGYLMFRCIVVQCNSTLLQCSA